MLLRGFSLGYGLVGIIVFELVEGEGDPVGEADGFGDGLGRFLKKLRHFVRRFQMPFGIGFEKPACLVQGDMLADAGDDVLQFAPLGRVIEHIIGGQQRHTGGARHALPFPQAAAIIALMRHGDSRAKLYRVRH